MGPKALRLLVTISTSVGAGVLATAIIADSENGYAAGFVALPLLCLELLACIVLVIVGFVFLFRENLACLYFFSAALLLPVSTVGSAMLAKEFEIGAYKIEPMRPFPPLVANKILFNRDVTSEGVQDFWRNVLSEPSGTSERQLPEFSR